MLDKNWTKSGLYQKDQRDHYEEKKRVFKLLFKILFRVEKKVQILALKRDEVTVKSVPQKCT